MLAGNLRGRLDKTRCFCRAGVVRERRVSAWPMRWPIAPVSFAAARVPACNDPARACLASPRSAPRRASGKPCTRLTPGLQNTLPLGYSMTKANFWSAISLGDAFAQSGRKDEAAIWFRKTLAADPADVDAACGLVPLLLDQRFLAEAIETLEGCLRRNPFNLRLLAQQRRIGLALCEEKLWEDAEPWLRESSGTGAMGCIPSQCLLVGARAG